MGLDMYLLKKTYVKNRDHMEAESLHEVTVKRGGKMRDDIKPERVSVIEEEVAYWRKANQIHRWFVENVQDGRDDCGTYYVDRDTLKKLVDLCKQVLDIVEQVEGEVSNGTTHYPDGRVVNNTQAGQVVAQSAIAAQLLPTQEGFFFGSTDYDEYYMRDIKDTIEQIEPLLSEEGSFYYHSSW